MALQQQLLASEVLSKFAELETRVSRIEEKIH